MGSNTSFDVFEKYAVSPIASRISENIFPISLKCYQRYIKYRASHPVTFHKYIVGLESHKLHGPSWISNVRNHPDTLALVKTIDRRLSLLDLHYKSLLSKWGQVNSDQKTSERGIKAHSVVVESNGKKGYMVIIDSYDMKSDEENGNSDDSGGFTDYDGDEDNNNELLEQFFPYSVAIQIKNKYLK